MNDVLHSTNQEVHPGANGGGGGLPENKVSQYLVIVKGVTVLKITY